VSQLFVVPDAILTWLAFVASPTSVLPRFWMRPPPPEFLFGLDYVNAVHIYGLKTLEPLLSGLVACGCALYLFGNRGVGVLRFLTILLLTQIVFDHISLFGEDRTTLFLTRHGYASDNMYDSVSRDSRAMIVLVLRTYPLVLMMMVVPRRSRRRPPAGLIWWTTAAALCMAAAPIICKWIDGFPAEWYFSAVRVFSWWFGRSWEASVMGVGDMARSLASLSVIVLVPWIVLRGPRGRPALMISAALLVAWAGLTMIAYMGLLLPQSVMMARWLTGTLHGCLEDPASLLASGGIVLAFPLGVRMALSLAEVRARLDGLRTVAAEGA
jgi:hypothetical protein